MKFVRTLVILALWNTLCAAELSPLAKAPDWSRLEIFQETITRGQFEKLLREVYAPAEAAEPWITINENGATILRGKDQSFVLRFGKPGSEKPLQRHWTTPDELPAAPAASPLRGYRIALDPGHLGGPWAKMEGRWFQIGNSTPVTEGDMTLKVARILSNKLRQLGAEVYLVRNSSVPTTAARPENLRVRARQSLFQEGQKLTTDNVRRESERLFYRVAEIRGRALFINTRIKPDLVLCLHFNAEAWGDPSNPQLTETNHFHFLVNGCYQRDELQKEDVRFEMLHRLLSRSAESEIALSEALGTATEKITGLPPYVYGGGNAIRLGKFTWGRNLLANRLYDCPVVFPELYVMNSKSFVAGLCEPGPGSQTPATTGTEGRVFEEYAESIACGLKDYFAEMRKKKTACQ